MKRKKKKWILPGIIIAVIIVGLASFLWFNFISHPSCTPKIGEQREVTLGKKLGNAACGYKGITVNIEYHKSIYEGNDGCLYEITDKRIIKYKQNGKEEVYYYTDVQEGDTILGEVEIVEAGPTVHCLVDSDSERADYIPVFTFSNLTSNPIHFQHYNVFKKVS